VERRKEKKKKHNKKRRRRCIYVAGDRLHACAITKKRRWWCWGVLFLFVLINSKEKWSSEHKNKGTKWTRRSQIRKKNRRDRRRRRKKEESWLLSSLLFSSMCPFNVVVVAVVFFFYWFFLFSWILLDFIRHNRFFIECLDYGNLDCFVIFEFRLDFLT